MKEPMIDNGMELKNNETRCENEIKLARKKINGIKKMIKTVVLKIKQHNIDNTNENGMQINKCTIIGDQ
jgi:hypothetical protein